MFDRVSDYKYSCSRIIVTKLNNGMDFKNGVTYIKSGCGVMARDSHVDVELLPGTYAVFTVVDWEDNCYTDRQYAITRYGPGNNGVEDISKGAT